MFAARALLGTAFQGGDELYGYVHSLYANAVNFDFELPGGEWRLFTLLRAQRALLPDCASVPPPCFAAAAALTPGEAVRKNGPVLTWSGSRPARLLLCGMPSGWERSRSVSPRKSDLEMFYSLLSSFCTQKASGFSKLPARAGEDLRRFARAVCHADGPALAAAFESLEGLGIGLTPSCDDAIIGALGLGFGAFLSGMLAGGVPRYHELIRPVLERMLAGERRTTKVSEKYLKCACRGEFSVSLRALTQAAFAGEREACARAMEEVSRLGHTSGMDTLTGVLALADCLRADLKESGAKLCIN